MHNLIQLRKSWESIQSEETRLLRAMSIRESVSQWIELQSSFELQLQQTEALFEPDRRNYLIAFQARIRRLVK